MGTPLPPNEPGVHCPTCWGRGKPFGDKKTPSIIIVELLDYEEGDKFTAELGNELELPHELFQSAIPCNWESVDTILKWQLGFTLSDTILLIANPAMTEISFASAPNPICAVTSLNLVTDLPDSIIFSGKMNLTWYEM